ncbi:MAG: branched-chain amino acid aminotransferase [Ornithinimicrobium sp.]|uniref:branched-chain amino acid aminotransferase n=1 Tax=Ornithinimicrobium sp. TaxID=1977084 RepID=UPI003D9BF1CB
MTVQTTSQFAIDPRADRASSERILEVLENPAFGSVFTDHMARIDWDAEHGWHDGRVTAYGPIPMDPACAVFHYGQEIFEGMKAYRHADGSIWTFRPERNAERFARSARRLALPEVPEDVFLDALAALVGLDQEWVPSPDRGETSLYLRPFMIATEVGLGVRPSKSAAFVVIASPAGAYFASGVKPVSIWLSEDYSRAAPGGTGAAKCGGNYGASLAPMKEGQSHGCDQVAFLDAVEGTWVEELGGMNLFFVYRDGTIVTPELTGTILEGVTRDSIIALARERGHEVVERKYSIEEWRDGVAAGDLVEVFACGTAAVITPVGRLLWHDGELTMGDGEAAGPVAAGLRESLLDIQYGRTEDTHGWLHRLS